MVEHVSQEFSGIDILVYSVTAKTKDFYWPFTECSFEGWRTIIQVKLDGLFLVA